MPLSNQLNRAIERLRYAFDGADAEAPRRALGSGPQHVEKALEMIARRESAND